MRDEPPAGEDLRPVGLYLFLAGLSTLIGAALIGYLIVRLRARTWPPEGVPDLPAGLIASTVILIVSSFAIHHASVGVRREDGPAIRRGLLLTLALAIAFLTTQVLCGWAVLAAAASRPKELFSFTFVMLASLHGVHVLGGMIPLTITTRRALNGAYDHRPDDRAVPLVATYWHFLDVVWLVMFVLLMV